MSLRFIAGLATARRVAVGTALAATLSLATIAAADQQVTALLRNGERVAGLFDGYNNNQVYVDVSASDERKIPVGDVVLLDFVGGAQGLPETELSQARGDDHVLLLKSGGATKGRLVSVEGTDRDPTMLFRTASGEERRVRFSEVGRLYLGRYPGAAPANATAPTATTATATGQSGAVSVSANQRWVSTGISVAKGQQVSFSSSGEVQLSTDGSDVATTAGSKIGRRLSAGPLPGQLAGALIGRVGNGQAFGIGNQAGPLGMPDGGVLFLGVNDDNVDDNQGAFNVTVSTMPTTVTPTPTGSRPGRIRRP
ncbi:MAG: hypothetical protein ABIT71_03535 [Vicinamibacteraceae bacterium]